MRRWRSVIIINGQYSAFQWKGHGRLEVILFSFVGGIDFSLLLF